MYISFLLFQVYFGNDLEVDLDGFLMLTSLIRRTSGLAKKITRKINIIAELGDLCYSNCMADYG